MNKNIITCLDTETTGLNPKEDFIIQLSAVNIDTTTMSEIGHLDYYIIPPQKFEISQASQDVHGITKEFLLDNGVYLKDIAHEVLDFIKDSYAYLTYNGNSFDFKFILKDFAAAGYNFPMDKICFDSYAMECKLQPRDLSNVYKKYTGVEFDNAHNSLSDVRATVQVFKNQVNSLKSHDITLENLETWKENRLLDPSGFIRDTSTTDDMRLVFAVGKYKDSDVYEVLQNDPSYLSWWAKDIAIDYTKNIVRDYLKKMREKSK